MFEYNINIKLNTIQVNHFKIKIKLFVSDIQNS